LLTLVSPDIVPIVMAGIIAIYGLVVSVLIANDLNQRLPLYTGFIQLGAGLAVGLAGLAAGFVDVLLRECIKYLLTSNR
jgi:V-type H+-transporting ATPase proteolipid subunit